ncbi:unnamed protein product [Musa acuminata var. zebrina]
MSLLTSPSHLSIFLSLYKEPRVQSLKMDPILKWHLGFSMGKMVLFHSLENCLCLVGNHPFNPLAAKAATISLSAFGPGGPFGFDFFSNKPNRQNNRSSQKGSDSTHESQSNEWLESGQCPIAKSYRAVSGVLPLVAKVLKPPAGVKLRCPTHCGGCPCGAGPNCFCEEPPPTTSTSKDANYSHAGHGSKCSPRVWKEHTTKFATPPPPVVCCSSCCRTFHCDA